MGRGRRGLGRRKAPLMLGGGRQGRPLIIYGSIAFGIGLALVVLMIAADARFLIKEALVLLIGGVIAMIRGVVHVTAERRASVPLGAPPGGGLGAPPGYGQVVFPPPGQGFASQGQGGFASQGQGFGAPAPGMPGLAGPASAPPVRGFASPPAPGLHPAPGFTAPPQQGYGAPGYPGAPGPGAPASPGFTPAPGFTPQAVGGPPMPGWYADPQNPTMLRWWDGQAWTARTQPTSASFPVGPAN
jgi:hypothetical protein